MSRPPSTEKAPQRRSPFPSRTKGATGGRGRVTKGTERVARADRTSRIRRAVLLLGSVLLAGAAVAHFWSASASAQQPSSHSGSPAKPAMQSAQDGAARPATAEARRLSGAQGESRASQAGTGPLPSSLEGTEVDGSLDVDDDGHLVSSPRVIALFDYFFSASGEEPESVLRARVEAYARAHLGSPALEEALDLLDEYVAYREAGSSLPAMDGASPQERLAAIQKLRRTHFGDDAESLFGAEERAAEIAVEKSKIAEIEGLDAEDRDSLFAEVDSRLPEADQRARKEATKMLTLRADEAILREGGADEGDIRRYREGLLGADAADRLEALDKERAAFKSRIEVFKTARDQRCGVPADVSCEAVLLEKSFDAREQIRVRTILSMKAP